MSIFKDTDYAELGQTFAAACQKADNAHAKTVTLQHEYEKRQKRERAINNRRSRQEQRHRPRRDE